MVATSAFCNLKQWNFTWAPKITPCFHELIAKFQSGTSIPCHIGWQAAVHRGCRPCWTAAAGIHPTALRFKVPEFLGSKLWEILAQFSSARRQRWSIPGWAVEIQLGPTDFPGVFQLITSGGLFLGSVGIELDLRLGHFLSKDQMSWDRG